MKKTRPLLLVSIISIAALVIAYFSFFKKAEETTILFSKVKQGKFEVVVISTGELKAKNQTEITAPGSELQEAQIYSELKIEDLIQEGTTVKAGDYVASLEKNPIMAKLTENGFEVQKKTSELAQAKLDTTLTLRDARDELYNLKFAVEQARLEKEQSKFEAPAIQRQKEIELEKAQKNYEQKLQNYKTKVAQSQTKVQIINSDLSIAQNRVNRLESLINKLNITAPKDGMLIYVRDWNGSKKVVGSSISGWNPTVAILPDLSQMQVITYVNEIDIQKVKIGQFVEIGLDADQNKKLNGVVASVANVGEQRPNSDAKVFEVIIDVITKDPSLRPAMTTSCKIYAGTYNDVLNIPLESINNDKNGTFVYKKDGNKVAKQYILVGATNDANALIYSGLKKDEEIYLTLPADTTSLKVLAVNKAAKMPSPAVDATRENIIKQFTAKPQAQVTKPK
ncbi:MAG: efflux RND transporter periplasmic adaptor subunit [Spirosomataceae bacterium]